MERIWRGSYPLGVPTDIDPSQLGSVVDLTDEFRDEQPKNRLGNVLRRALHDK